MASKFCIDCKYYEEWDKTRWTIDRHRCNYEQRLVETDQEVDIVTGKPIPPKIGNCYVNRRDSYMCGPEGAWYEPKE